MHNAAFSALALNWAYLAFPVDPERVGEAVRGLAALGVRGVNITIPHKQAVIQHCSATSAAVNAIGAANTLIADGNGGFRCDNTDATGFLRALDEVATLDLNGEEVLMLGAGGAARAVAWALRGRGARITVANRTEAKAAELGDRTIPFEPRAIEAAASGARLIVNSTSLGLRSGAESDVLPRAGLGPGQIAYDIVYRPGGSSDWLDAVRARGATTVDGLGMLLHQGAAAFVQWTGVEPPIEVMRAALAGGADPAK